MEQWIRDNFNIVQWKNDDGTKEEAFEYQFNDKTRKTKLLYFIDNLNKFENLIDYWKSQGIKVPQ